METLNILITGGAGFIGSNLISHLLSLFDKINIISLDNYSSGFKTNHVKNENVKYLEGNTWDINNIYEIQNFNPKYVFHFGEFSRIYLSFMKTNETFWSNFIGTQQILEYCVKKQAKLIYSCSSATFLDNNSSPYVFTKAQNIKLIQNYNIWFGLNYAITYFYNVYGKNQICDGDYATVIGIFENQYKNNLPLTIVGDGSQRRIFTHVDDIVEGLVLIMEKGHGDNYCLASNDDYSILELAQLFKTDYIFLPERKGDRKFSRKTKSKSETELNWICKKNLKDYISTLF